MKSKVFLAIAVITLLAVATIYYLGRSNNSNSFVLLLFGRTSTVNQTTPTPTPTTEVSSGATGVTESSTITVKDGSKTEKLVFHNASGFTFMSYTDVGVTDKVVVSVGENEILQLGVNWTGYTQGSLPLMKLVTVKNAYLGTLYRATGGGIADGGYTLASLTKTTGKCAGDGDPMDAPCTNNDQVYGKSNVFTYLPFCSDLDSVAQCDQLMSGLEITR